MSNEGGSEFSPEPAPEVPIETPAEVAPETPAIEVAPEPPQVDTTLEPSGTDQDVLSEAKTEEGAIDIATAENAGSQKISEEINEKLSDAGVEGANEMVATGNLSNNPEHAANELAAVREHADQRTAFLIEQAKAAETDELRQAQELDAEADAMEAAWQSERAAGSDDLSRESSAASVEEAARSETIAQLDPEAQHNIEQQMREDEQLEDRARLAEDQRSIDGIEELSQTIGDGLQGFGKQQETTEISSVPQYELPPPERTDSPIDPLVATGLVAGLGIKRASEVFGKQKKDG